uniref:Aquaporin n=1 Tax=Acrobeloides nanus TaxID=290746 RepID=A0A914BWS6_9BILA
MCTCVYENGIMIEYYGLVGFFFTVICALIAGSIYNREAFVSPLPPIENFWYGSYRVDKLITIIIAEAIGGYAAFRIARALWYYSSGFFQEHYALYDNLSCELIYHVPFWAAVLFEIFGCFLLRLAVPRIPQDYQFYLEPVFVSGVITFALGFIGVAGLNPVVTSSALQGCEGLGLEWFIFIYWVCPVIGWMLAAHLEHKSTPKIGEGVKKRQ